MYFVIYLLSIWSCSSAWLSALLLSNNNNNNNDDYVVGCGTYYNDQRPKLNCRHLPARNRSDGYKSQLQSLNVWSYNSHSSCYRIQFFSLLPSIANSNIISAKTYASSSFVVDSMMHRAHSTLNDYSANYKYLQVTLTISTWTWKYIFIANNSNQNAMKGGEQTKERGRERKRD